MKSNLLVRSKDGGRYVAVSALMSPLVALADGLPVNMFGGSRKPYLDLATAIAWVEREIDHASCTTHEDNLRKALSLLIAYRDAPEAVVDVQFRFNADTGRMEPTGA